MWKTKTLSKAGRLVLIKAVLNNLPMYYLSLFKLPKNVAKQIVRMQRRFFWGKEVGSKGGNLISWEVIQKPIDQGGLGVGDIHIRNAALLFKWWWRFADDHHPLWKRVVSSIHNTRHIGDLQNNAAKISSSLWGQIVNIKNFSKDVEEVAKKGLKMKVGNGARTRFWLDNWIGSVNLKTLFPRLFMISTQQQFYIHEMGRWESNRWTWKFLWRRKLFAWEEELVADLYLAVDHISLSERATDVRIWTLNKSKTFSVSDFYYQVTRTLGDENNQFRHGKLAWTKVAPPRAQLLVWFVLQGRLNTKERLYRFGFPGLEDNMCTFCKEKPETVHHIMFGCKFSSSLWYFACNRWNLSFCMPMDPVSCLLSWMGSPFRKFDKNLWNSLFYVISWSIWWLRNKVVFENMEPRWNVEKELILWRLGSWTKGWCQEFPYLPGQMSENLQEVRRWSGRIRKT